MKRCFLSSILHRKVTTNARTCFSNISQGYFIFNIFIASLLMLFTRAFVMILEPNLFINKKQFAQNQGFVL